MMRWAVGALESGRVPDGLARAGIRFALWRRLREIESDDAAAAWRRTESLARAMRQGPVALTPEKANEQHYEVPAEFFELVLGRRLKYSCCYWPEGVADLDAAEEASLAQTCGRAGIEDGMEILELGCGWGALSLWLAERYPRSRILAVSNSTLQRRFIEAARRERGLEGLEVVTADMNHFATARRFDRVVSIEMFEHMRNYEELLRRIRGWLHPGGRLFVHHFCHRRTPYVFEDQGPGDWMARHFFTNGLMPSERLLESFDRDLAVERRWRLDGRHYARTAGAWCDNLERRREGCRRALSRTWGGDCDLWLRRWRIFFQACAELFGYRDGSEWFVSQALLRRAEERREPGPQATASAAMGGPGR